MTRYSVSAIRDDRHGGGQSVLSATTKYPAATVQLWILLFDRMLYKDDVRGSGGWFERSGMVHDVKIRELP